MVGEAGIAGRRGVQNPTVECPDHHAQLTAHIVGGQHHVVLPSACRLGQRRQTRRPDDPQNLTRRQSALNHRWCFGARRIAWNGLCVRRRRRNNTKRGEADTDCDPGFQEHSP